MPFTLQTFAIFSALILLGGQKALYSILVYIFLGAIGLPVFSGFKNGAGVLLGTTGGYIIGFIPMALIYLFFEKHFQQKPLNIFIALIIGLIVCYTFGTMWFIFVYAKKVGSIALSTVIMWCVVPFILPDIIKMFLAYFIVAKRVKPMLKK